MRILALDTATECCSAAMWVDGDILQRQTETDRGHSQLILPMVDELLAESGVRLTALDVIAFGRGPGSFTGVRLAASVTQGLAFAAQVPVLGVSDLRAEAQWMRMFRGAERVLVCNDARMQEVYWACFEATPAGLMSLIGREHVGPPAQVALPPGWAVPIHGAGRGFAAYPGLLAAWVTRLAGIESRILPQAAQIAVLAEPEVRAGQALSAEQALPVYIRDEVARPSS